MARRPSRSLDPEEAELWAHVTRTARPLARRPAPASHQAEAMPSPRPRKTSLVPAAASKTKPIKPQTDVQWTGVERRLQRALRRGTAEIDATLDLHGLTQGEAQRRLAAFVRAAHGRGDRILRIITGKGTPSTDAPFMERPRGVLRARVPSWLSEPPLAGLVLGIVPAGPRQGGEGALYVVLRRGRGGQSVTG